MKSIQLALLLSAMALCPAFVFAQQLSASPLPNPGDTWGQLKVLAPHTHMHVSADHGGATCYLIAVDEASLTCGRHSGSPQGQHVFPRAEVKSVKLTRYAISTVGGLGIGAGVGALAGIGVVRSSDWFAGDARAVLALGGGLIGAAIGGPTDMFRGPTIYRRVPSR